MKNNDFKKIIYKGGVINCPSDWIILENTLAPKEECRNVGLIEVRNSRENNIPRFVFFANKSVHDYTEEEIQTVYNACTEAWPEFANLIEKQIEPPDFSDNGFHERAAEHLNSPYIGMFDFYVINSQEANESD